MEPEGDLGFPFHQLLSQRMPKEAPSVLNVSHTSPPWVPSAGHSSGEHDSG